MDKEHWNHIEQGDINAYSETYIFYYKKLFNYGRKFTDNTALIEDAIQAIFAILWINRKKLFDIRSPHSYIYYSFRNYILKEKRKLQDVVFQKEEQEFGIDNLIINKETTSELNMQLIEALKSLTPRQREAIFLRFYEALSFEEVAQIMDISIKGTYKLVARSLLKLKEQLHYPVLLIIALLQEVYSTVL